MIMRLGTELERKTILEKYPYTCQVLGDGGYLIVAVDESRIIGFLWSFVQDSPGTNGEKELFINVVEVFETQSRCKGVGSAMVTKCLSLARQESFYQVRAYCSIHNIASNRLWVKNGFAISPVKMPDNSIPGSYVTYKL